MRRACIAACSAAVPLLTATASAAPTRCATAFSNSSTRGPVVSHSDLSVSTTAAMSWSSIHWRPYASRSRRVACPPLRASSVDTNLPHKVPADSHAARGEVLLCFGRCLFREMKHACCCHRRCPRFLNCLPQVLVIASPTGRDNRHSDCPYNARYQCEIVPAHRAISVNRRDQHFAHTPRYQLRGPGHRTEVPPDSS